MSSRISYAVHPGVAMVQKRIKELPVKTGRSLDQWIALTIESGPSSEKERREWLKKVRVALRPLYEQLMKLGFSLGKDVKACPGKTAVPLYRRHVFAQIGPATNTTIDLGLALGNMKTPKRLINTGGYENITLTTVGHIFSF